MNIEIDIVVILLSIIFFIFFIKILCMCYNNDEKNNQKARIRSRTLSDEQLNKLHSSQFQYPWVFKNEKERRTATRNNQSN